MRKFLISIFLMVELVASATDSADFNGDGFVNVGDVTALYEALLAGSTDSKYDLNADDKINVGDVAVLYDYILTSKVEDVEKPEYVVGGDISLLPRYIARGAKYYDTAGKQITSPLEWFHDEAGMNAMRVRLFVNPANAPADDKEEGVCQDLAYVTALGKQIKDAGMQFVLDLHYSDTWADPGQQTMPSLWNGITAAGELADSVYAYTTRVLSTLKAAGATPDYIQTGNEITAGMLWPTGHVYADGGAYSGGSWDYLMMYLNAAAKACREQCPNAGLIIHVELGRTTTPQNFFKTLTARNGDFDFMGISFYPAYHGNLSTLETVLSTLESQYPSKGIMIMETGYPAQWALNDTKYDLTATYPYSDAGQKAFTAALITTLKKHNNVKGLFWWWPEANEYNIPWSNHVTAKWYNATLFNNNDGRAFPAVMELKAFAER